MQNAGFRALKPLPTRISSLFGVFGLVAVQQVAACENPVGRLETAESVVEMRAAASGDWVRIMPAQPLCEGDQVAVRAPGRASVVLEGDILVRLDQNTTLTLTHVPPDADARLGMVEGLIHVITRFRKRFEVNTPFVNAMVEGTEFSVKSADGAGRVVVIEGQVRVANAGGEQTLATGEAAIARGEHAPGKIELRALDTVRWAIHYPQIMWLDATARARLPASLGNTVDAAQSAMAQSKHAEALRLLDAAGPHGQAAELAPLHVSVLLALGRIEPARKLLAAVPAGGASALALEALLAVTVNDLETADSAARRAVAADPENAAAQLALSYALQAGMDVPAAHAAAARATALAPENPFGWTRRAELELSLARTGAARASAAIALERAPGLARAHALVGFADLLERRLGDADAALARAVAADPGDPFARFAKGLVALKRGQVSQGRSALELAVLLDPTNAELRSYLGRIYLEEQRSALAADQFELARTLDPGSPTPWFFDAYRRLRANDPLGALADTGRALELNENRAVFRSPELIDSDRAARSTLQGLAFGEVGFDRPMRMAAIGALGDDPLSASAHRLLADSYGRETGLESARASQYLQMSLRQPLGAAPVPPQVLLPGLPILSGSRLLSPEEVTDVVGRKPVHFSASGLGGSQDTLGGTVTVARTWERAQLSLGAFRYRSDGVGDNADVDLAVDRVALQFAPTASTMLHAEAWQSDESGGDIGQRFFDDQIVRGFDTERRLGRVAFRTLIDAQSELIGSYAVSDIDVVNTGSVEFAPGMSQKGLIDESVAGRELGLQYLRATSPYTVTLGVTRNRRDRETRFEDTICCVPDEVVIGSPLFEYDEALDSAYGYLRYGVSAAIDAHMGAAYQRFESDDPFVAGEERTSGKLGLVYRPNHRVSVRAAWIQGVAGQYGLPGLEPTEFAGFVQQHDDPIASFSTTRALALDLSPLERVTTGLEWSARDLDVPNRNCGLAPCNAPVEITRYRAHAGWQLDPRVALSVEWAYESSEQSTFAADSFAYPVEVRTTQLPLRAWFGLGHGWSVSSEALRIDQRVGLLGDGAVRTESESFWLANFRLRRAPADARWSVDVELRNAFDQDFRYQDPNIFGSAGVPRYLPERSAFLAFRYQF